MKKLTIKLGVDMKEDIKKAFLDPAERRPGTHTLYLKDFDDLRDVLFSPKKLSSLIELINRK